MDRMCELSKKKEGKEMWGYSKEDLKERNRVERTERRRDRPGRREDREKKECKEGEHTGDRDYQSE